MSLWSRLGLRGRLALSIGALVLAAFALVFVAVRGQMANEARVIDRGEARERSLGEPGAGDVERSRISPIADAQEDVERTFLLVGAAALAAALAGGYLLAARTASPLRRMAATATEVQGGNLTPRLEDERAAAPELRTLVSAFNQMLDRLDAAFSRQRRFVSDASHELRTPLTAIRGQLEVLAREQSPGEEDVLRVTALALEEMRRVERLVDDLLALARLDERASLRTRWVEVPGLLRELAAADPSRASLGELATGSVDADPDLIAQVVRNLLANARRAAGEEGRVELSGASAGDRLAIRVDDDGPGLPEEERERVFDRFHRAQSARDRGSGGSGLGLAISRAIAEAHGGRIWIESSPLGGARAVLELPGFEPG
jgi:two-component system OmpR family sensor kinase